MVTTAGGENIDYTPSPEGGLFTPVFSTFSAETLEGGEGDTLGGGPDTSGGGGDTSGGGGGGGTSLSEQLDILYGGFDQDWFF